MKNAGMIPVFNHADIEVSKKVVDAAYKGGVRVFEFTNRGNNPFEVFKALLDHVKQYPDLILGIGTIMDATTARKYLEVGAHFIVSPILKEEVALECNKQDVVWIPGCGTVTEIVNGKELGAQVVKVFPASVLGPGFVKAVLSVVPDVNLMPTGGVEPTEENLRQWYKAGVICVGMGSQLFDNKLIAENQWDVITEKVQSTFQIIKKLRG